MATEPPPFAPGDVVRDKNRSQTGVVRTTYDGQVEVIRPSGTTWWARTIDLRSATRVETERLEINRQLERKRRQWILEGPG